MFKPPLQHTRIIVRSPIYFPKRGLESSSASDHTNHVNQVVNEFQAAQGITNAGRVINEICQRLAKDRLTTQTEQLIWLARYSLDASEAHKHNVDGNGKPAVQEQPKIADNGKQPATCEDDKQARGVASVNVDSLPGLTGHEKVIVGHHCGFDQMCWKLWGPQRGIGDIYNGLHKYNGYEIRGYTKHLNLVRGKGLICLCGSGKIAESTLILRKKPSKLQGKLMDIYSVAQSIK
ncbi:CcmA, ABC-type multidrug transport system, ATPase component [Pyrenophora tritici-repentis]|nr:CcmA, ABC-type multidrug transport system, ATPase component [Pyrenophora tritici-repentis]